MSRRTKRKKARRPEVPSRKRLTTAQRWKWSIFFALASGALFVPYVVNAIHERNLFAAIVLVGIGGGATTVFVVTLKHH